jgi:hypothetical protein
MVISDLLATIDSEIAKLQRARALLSGGAAPAGRRKPGRPKKTEAAVTKAVARAAEKPAKKKRKLSAETRKRIADAARKRWAVQRAAAAK